MEGGQKLKELVSIAIILLVIATTVSSIESFSNKSANVSENITETKATKLSATHDVLNTVKLLEGNFFANRPECGLFRLSVKSDELSKNDANALNVVKFTEPSVSHVKSKINFTSCSNPSESVSDCKLAQILPASSSFNILNTFLGSTSTVTCSFHACGGCNPQSLPYSCTPNCDGTLSGCDSEIDDYYCYEEGNCFSEAGCDSGGGDYTKTCNCEAGSCPPDYPHYCGGSCWSDCTNSDYPHWNCKSDGTAVCCPSGYPYYCEKTNSCWSKQEYCDRCEYCGGSWRVCIDPTNHPTCYDGQFYCCPYNYPFYCNGDCWNTRETPCNGFAILSGVVQDEDENPVHGAIVKWTYCNDTPVISDTTDSDGAFYLKAPAGSYRLKVTSNSITYPFIVDGTACYYYAPDAYSWLLTISTRTMLYGYIKDLDNNPLEGLTVELHDCSSDTLIASDDTDSTGYFSVTADAGYYKIHIAITEAYRIKLVDSTDNDCFLLVGDIDTGTLNINPTPDCSVFNYRCYGPAKNKKLFNCYWDDGCWCYGQECRCGCTDGALECDPCDVGTIYVDVDNINDNNNPLPGAKVYLEGEYKGTTDSFGKKAVSAGYGYQEVKVECPDGSYCGSQTVYVDGNEYLYFDCACYVPEHKGDILITLTVIADDTPQGGDYLSVNGKPIAKAYVYLDDRDMGLTDLAGQIYLDDVGYGTHTLDLYFHIIDPEYGAQTKWGRIELDVNTSYEILNLGVYDYELFSSSGLNSSVFHDEDRAILQITNYTGNYTPEIAPLVAILVVIAVAGVAWDTYNIYDCAQKYPMPDDITRWVCWDEVGWLGVNFIPVGAIASRAGKFAVLIGKEIKYITIIGETVKTVEKAKDITNLFTVVSKYGDETVKYTVRYADDGSEIIQITKNAAAVLLRDSDEAAWAVRLVYNKGDDFAEIGSRTISKGQIEKVGDLGEIMITEFANKIDAKYADDGIEIVVKRGSGKLGETGKYIFEYAGVDGENIIIKSKQSGEKIGEIDRLIEINKKPVIVEAKTGKYSNFKDDKDMEPSKLLQKIEAVKELYKGNEPELVLIAPKDQVRDMASHSFVTNLKGKVIPFATTNSEFQNVGRAFGVI